MIEMVYSAFFPFGGIGAGAHGILAARMSLLGHEGRFRSLGGLDLDAAACADFEYLTGTPELCADVATVEPEVLRALVGPRAPDLVFLSPPCKGASGLLSEAQSQTARYRAMNELALAWIRLMLRTWDEPPRLVLLENVPRLKARAGSMLRAIRSMLGKAGYVCSDGYHDCGEIGGLAQHRRRYLLVARHQSSVSPILYQPVKRRVLGCGEVLGPMPMPEDPAGGPMHRLPRISWLNWVRLALIPAGGDWRDLPRVLAERAIDPNPAHPHEAGPGFPDGEQRAGIDPAVGLAACKEGSYHNNYRVENWAQPAHTVVGATRPGSGAPSIADPRARAWFPNVLGVVPWTEAVKTVTGQSRPTNGRFAVADPRVKTAFDHGYGVLPWTEPSSTVAGKSYPGNGAYSVADPRLSCEPRAGAYGVLPWTEAAKTVTGAARIDNGAWAVADPRLPDAPPLMVITDPRRPPPHVPIIIAADGTWHRPLTTLELAALQGLPTTVNGRPLQLHGSSVSAWRERIGNAVPPPAAQAIGERMLVALLQADLGSFALASPDSPVWVEPETPAALAREAGRP